MADVQKRAFPFGLPLWTLAAPAAGLLALAFGLGAHVPALAAVALGASILAAVHHAEVVALKLGEPFGTLMLAVAVTVIEAGLILSLMADGGIESATVARDAVFAAVMIILNGIVGICLLIGALRHHEQQFTHSGVSAALAVLATLTIMTLVLPNFTASAAGPVYSASQLAFVAALSFILYGTFVLVQTVRHRDYFLATADEDEDGHADPPPARTAWFAFGLLVASLFAVILLAKGLAPVMQDAVEAAGLPVAVVGIAIAAIVLGPEGLAAARAASHDRLQTSLNLALGSALATIGLTIPVVAIAALWLDLPLALGIDAKSMTLLILSLMVATLAFSTGRTTILQGATHLVIFAVYLFTALVP